MIPTDMVYPNSWNPNLMPESKQRALRNYIEKTGFVEPIQVRPDKNGKYEISNGEHRWKILKDLGAEKVPCIVIKENDVEAKLRTVAMDALRGQFVPVKLANVIHDLNKTMSTKEIEKLAGLEEPEISDLLKLQKIPQDLNKDLERRLQEEEQKAPVLLTFMVSHRKASVVNKQIDDWLKKNKDSNRGDWLWTLAKRIR